jgi:Protein of unknown function (DUF2934)
MPEIKRNTRSRKSNVMPLTRASSFDPLRFAPPPAPPRPREELIAELAYFRALDRGFEPGHEVEDWLAAEADVNQRTGTLRLR